MADLRTEPSRIDVSASDAWIDKLAADIREKNREAAQAYGRNQHFAEVVARLGKEFFVRLITQLEQDVDVLRRKLQGDATSAETTAKSIRAGELRITRERFPWVDATVTHRDDTILVDYAKGAGLAGDPMLDRKSRAFTIRAGGDDRLYAEDAFADSPERFDTPEDLARCIVQFLFEA
jgi:hypothetical protein